VGAAVTHHQNHNSTVTESGVMVSMCSLSLLKQCKEYSSTGRGQTHSLAPTIVSRLLVLVSALSFLMQGPGEFISFAAFAKKSCFNHVTIMLLSLIGSFIVYTHLRATCVCRVCPCGYVNVHGCVSGPSL